MITKETLAEVKTLCRDVIRECDRVQKECEDDGHYPPVVGTARTGALRRRTMDLTRALAILRSSDRQ